MSKKINLRPKRVKIREIFRFIMLPIGIFLMAFGVVVQFAPGTSTSGIHWVLVGMIFTLIASTSGADLPN